MVYLLKMICPITRLPIRRVGITCIGNAYEYDAIKKWFETKKTDPVTNLDLESKFVIDFGYNKSAEEVYQKCNYVLKNAKLWSLNLIFKDIYAKAQLNYEKNNKIYNLLIKMLPVESLKKKNKEAKNTLNCNINYLEKLKFFFDDSQFMNLSKLNIKNKVYKSRNFSGANLSSSAFIDCNFSRCNFYGANLKNTIFVNCQFIGEQVLFHEARFSKYTKFAASKMA